MYKHILIAIDGSELANKAVTEGLALAAALNARVTVVTVSEPISPYLYSDATVGASAEDFEKCAAANAFFVLGSAADVATKLCVPCETVHVKNSYPADGIIEVAKSRGCDLIVMASHGRRGLSQLVLGSQTNRVVSLSTLPVLVTR
jgi:nucleotide-binding universal stress UspA family protein